MCCLVSSPFCTQSMHCIFKQNQQLLFFFYFVAIQPNEGTLYFYLTTSLGCMEEGCLAYPGGPIVTSRPLGIPHNPAISSNAESPRSSSHSMTFQNCKKILDVSQSITNYSTLNDYYIYSTVKLNVYPDILKSWPERLGMSRSGLLIPLQSQKSVNKLQAHIHVPFLQEVDQTYVPHFWLTAWLLPRFPLHFVVAS